MQPAQPPLARERNLILGLLIGLTTIGWLLVIWQARDATGDDMGTGMSGMEMDEAMGLTMGLGAALFGLMWVAMMVAMMFPTAAPMIMTFSRISAGKRERGQTFVPTWVFVLGYLIVWSAFGIIAYGLAVGAEALAERSMWLIDNAARIGGGVLLLAGLYQLSPLKDRCLSSCRTPLQFVMTSWRDGYAGALRMGIVHGAYCLGCCWLLFLALFPLGIMNLGAMALMTALIFAEKSTSIGRRIGQVAGVGLIAYGLLVVAVPGTLLTTL